MNATATKGLGKGLSALIGESYSQTIDNVQEKSPSGTLDIEKISPGKFQPRQSFDKNQLQELADSITKNGIMQPIMVRAMGKKGQYEIIAGERRWRAAKMAGLTEIPVIIRDINDQQALELALVENVQRQDLGALEEAAGYQRLLDEFSYTQEELSHAVGKSRSHIANLLRLLSLPEEVKQMIDNSELTMGHARALLNAANPVELAQEIVRRGLNVRQTENLTRGGGENVVTAPRKPRNGKAAATSSNDNGRPKDPDIIALEETLSENLALKVSINDRGQSGEITLFYNSLTELDEILRRLGGSI